MSGAISALTIGEIAAGASVLGTAYSVYNGQRQSSAQKDAANRAQANASATAKASEEASNRANAKKPNIGAILDQALLAGKAGAGGTMLTGPMGVTQDQLSLGRATLLGGA